MSKKKFTSGLESLFGNSSEKAFQEGSPLIDVEESPVKRERSRGSGSGQVAAKRSSKNFTSDLETLFEQALSETFEEQTEQANQQQQIKKRANKPRKRLSGLDALIRNTGGMDYIEVNSPNKKRVTFVIDKPKLERLKEIARVKKLYLKDIIGEVMSKFIEKHEKNKGKTA
ncbi:MAG: hypothetical protein ACI8P3_000852 [Saprospiraceae bacterium]